MRRQGQDVDDGRRTRDYRGMNAIVDDTETCVLCSVAPATQEFSCCQQNACYECVSKVLSGRHVYDYEGSTRTDNHFKGVQAEREPQCPFCRHQYNARDFTHTACVLCLQVVEDDVAYHTTHCCGHAVHPWCEPENLSTFTCRLCTPDPTYCVPAICNAGLRLSQPAAHANHPTTTAPAAHPAPTVS